MTQLARALLAAALLCALAAPAQADRPAPGAPGDRHTWAAADKHGFGTATQLASHTWFTLRQAELTEVYYPDLGTPSLRQLEFVVTDGRRFIDRETGPGVSSRVEAIPGSLTFRQVTQTRRWRLTKTWIGDPARDAVLAKVRFRSLTGRRLRLYVLVDPAPGDDGNDDRGSRLGHGLTAWDDTVASVVAADRRLHEPTSGYAGSASDPWADLERDFDLDRSYEARQPGNVVQAARTSLTGERRGDLMTLAIGFGSEPATASRTARASLETGFGRAARAYAAGWGAYLGFVKRPPHSVRRTTFLRRVYDQSVMVLEASEDKIHRGASIASPTMPWVWGTLTLSGTENSGPYHLVWPRDLYHVATAQHALGDEAAAMRLLQYLWRVQKPDGSWWQNTEVSGEPHWTSTQLDEVSLPIVLAWWLGRTSAADWQHVRSAADYIVANGPESPQERWENQDGWSPNTIATEIAGLICAADIARRNGDAARAEQYEATADAWQRSVEDWTATDSTEYYSPAPYYVRVTKDANPNDGSDYNLGDNFPRPVDEREIVDQSFLGLVLFGVKPHDDPTVLNSLEVGDEVLKVVTPHGPVWYRFTHDGYGETASGADWDIFPTAARQTFGRLWPLLAGERGEYELLAGRDATPYLATIARTANDGLMLPEQVWDGRPPTGRPGHEFGEGTRSATPLAWTHGQLIRLAWSIDAGEPIERPSIVACRYAVTSEGCG
jgi:glucoamylase